MASMNTTSSPVSPSTYFLRRTLVLVAFFLFMYFVGLPAFNFVARSYALAIMFTHGGLTAVGLLPGE